MLRKKYIYNADIHNSTFPAKISVYKITIFSFSQDYDEYEETCHKCTWFKYSNNETFICDEFEDECEFGTGLKGKDYNENSMGLTLVHMLESMVEGSAPDAQEDL